MISMYGSVWNFVFLWRHLKTFYRMGELSNAQEVSLKIVQRTYSHPSSQILLYLVIYVSRQCDQIKICQMSIKVAQK